MTVTSPRKLALILLAGIVINIALVLAAVNGVGAATQLLATHEAGVQDRITVRGGVIRLGTHIYVHDNDTHASVGIRSLSWAPNRCDLVINTDAVDQTDEIIAAIAEEDESISRMGIQAGISGGGSKATIFLYRYDGRHICANDRRFGTVSNLWVQLTYLSDAPAS